jgi:hypothetical protein
MYRNKKLLEIARLLPCQHCGIEDGTVVAAHSNQLRDGKGRGLKSSDAMISSLCYNCHSKLDQGKNLNKQQRIDMWEEAHRNTMQAMIERELLIVCSKL